MSQKICFSLCSFFHYQIFNQIISIAGEFRQTEHKGNGMVYFGGYQQTEMKHQFRGSNPADIKSHLKEAFEYLLQQPNSNALENSLHFYQRFVKTHPFYDGNGRVARLFVNLYLLKAGLHLDWKNLQDQSKFLNKLNYYHKTEIEEHFQWWLSFCRKYLYQISEIDEK